ncbi:CbrC family protein [Streptomyces sp. PAM3C]|nr:CbrC family protein [Streptomyces sp. PAM3C]
MALRHLRRRSIPATSDGLPSFRHHPDPVATGSIRASTDRCVCCGRVTSATTT